MSTETRLSDLIVCQFRRLGEAFDIDRSLARQVLDILTAGPLGGSRSGGRRYSALNRDGLGFQWSIALSKVTADLRFLTDAGRPGMAPSERIDAALATITQLADVLPLPVRLAQDAIESILPSPAVLDATLMSVCFGVSLPKARYPGSGLRGTNASRTAGQPAARVKLYLNTEVGSVAERYKRLHQLFHRLGAGEHANTIRALSKYTFFVPAYLGLSLGSGGIDQYKCYFRTADASLAALKQAASATGANQNRLIATYRAAVEAAGTAVLSPRAVSFAVELPFPSGGVSPGLKLDLNLAEVTGSDMCSDQLIRTLIHMYNLPIERWMCTRDILASRLAERPTDPYRRQLLFAGAALRPSGDVIDLYLHPSPSCHADS